MLLQVNNNILIFLLTAIGLIALPHIANIPGPIFTLFALLLIWRIIGIWQRQWLPNQFLVFLITLTAIVLLVSQHQTIVGREAGSSVALTALALKLMEIRQKRDLYLICFFTFVVAATLLLFQQSIVMAVYILLVSCVLIGSLVSINSPKPQTWPALKTAAIIIVQAMPLAIIMFILFPRVEAPKWLLFEEQHTAFTGLSDSMEPGSISSLALSAELAFRVKFTGKIPPPNQRYWRGPVLSYTDGKRWEQTKNMYFKRFLDKTYFSGEAYHYKIMMEPQNNNWVFALDMPAQFNAPLTRNGNYQLITAKSPDQRAEYQITSYPKYNTGYITRTEYRDNLQLPGKPSDRLRALVKQLKGFDRPPEVFIKNLLKHFRSENFYYTLKPPLMEDNPIERFLFDSRSGFCSHYATAFVYLMRIADIPARVVTGYQGGELNAIGNFLEVRQANAHAWTEVWLQNKGWVRVDPTAAIAPQRIEQSVDIDQQIASGTVRFITDNQNLPAAISWLKQARQLWTNVDYNWQRWVINYNSQNQESFLSRLGIKDIKTMIYWMVSCIALIASISAGLILYQKPKIQNKAVLYYQKFCHKLSQQGLDRKQGEGAKDFAQRVIERFPERSIDVSRITALFIKIHYGQNADDNDLKQFKRQVELFKL